MHIGSHRKYVYSQLSLRREYQDHLAVEDTGPPGVQAQRAEAESSLAQLAGLWGQGPNLWRLICTMRVNQALPGQNHSRYGTKCVV